MALADGWGNVGADIIVATANADMSSNMENLIGALSFKAELQASSGQARTQPADVDQVG